MMRADILISVIPVRSALRLLAAAEFQQRDFRRASVPDRKHHGAETAVDVNLSISLAPKPFQHAAARTARGTPLTSNCDLATMRMTAQHEINRSANGTPEYDRIVRQQKFHLVATRARESQRQVFKTDHRIVYARQPDTFAVELKVDAFVNQDRHPFSAEKVRDQRRIGPMVVISEHSVNAVARLQTT